jgi:hypothetical protein
MQSRAETCAPGFMRCSSGIMSEGEGDEVNCCPASISLFNRSNRLRHHVPDFVATICSSPILTNRCSDLNASACLSLGNDDAEQATAADALIVVAIAVVVVRGDPNAKDREPARHSDREARDRVSILLRAVSWMTPKCCAKQWVGQNYRVVSHICPLWSERACFVGVF